MKTEGWILLAISWTVIISMLIFCYAQIFKPDKQKKKTTKKKLTKKRAKKK